MNSTEKNIGLELGKFEMDLGKCVHYFLDELDFSGVVVYKDPVGFSVAKHYHNSDDYTYVIEGELTLETQGVINTYLPGDLIIIKQGEVHAVLPGKGAKYIVASKEGDFDTIYI